MGICSQVTLLIYSIIGYPRIPLDPSDERGQQFGGYKEFKICLYCVSLLHQGFRGNVPFDKHNRLADPIHAPYHRF